MKLLTTLSAAAMVISVSAINTRPLPVDENGVWTSKDGHTTILGGKNAVEHIIDGDTPGSASNAQDMPEGFENLANQDSGSQNNPNFDKESQRISSITSGEKWQARVAEQLSNAQTDIASVESNEGTLSNLSEKEREEIRASKEKIAETSRKFPISASGQKEAESKALERKAPERKVSDEKRKSNGISEAMWNSNASNSSKVNKTEEAKKLVGAASCVTRSGWAILAGAAAAVLVVSV